MNRFFPIPLFSFLRIVIRNGGFSGKGILHSGAWWIKTILFEPVRWIELAFHSRKISRHSLQQDPVFILGYYRSGTTYLQQLFKVDERMGYSSSFQMVFPEIMLTGESWLTPPLEGMARLFKIQNPIHRVPFTWDSPGEEDVALTAFLNPLAAQWGYFFPKKGNEYLDKYVFFESIPEKIKEKWKGRYAMLLRKISLANRGRQLVLKNPPNTARIRELLSLYPRAKFVYIHRNPYEVFASNQRLWSVVTSSYSLGSKKSVNYSELILRSYQKIMDRYLEDRSLIPPKHLMEISYDQFLHCPLKAMESIYEQLNLPDFAACQDKMKVYVEQQKAYKRLDHRLPPESIERINKEWEPFFREWNYALQ